MLNIYSAIKLAIAAMLEKSYDINSQKGAAMIEYALIAALIAVAAIAVLPGIGTSITAAFTAVQTAFTTAGF